MEQQCKNLLLSFFRSFLLLLLRAFHCVLLIHNIHPCIVSYKHAFFSSFVSLSLVVVAAVLYLCLVHTYIHACIGPFQRDRVCSLQSSSFLQISLSALFKYITILLFPFIQKLTSQNVTNTFRTKPIQTTICLYLFINHTHKYQQNQLNQIQIPHSLSLSLSPFFPALYLLKGHSQTPKDSPLVLLTLPHD